MGWGQYSLDLVHRIFLPQIEEVSFWICSCWLSCSYAESPLTSRPPTTPKQTGRPRPESRLSPLAFKRRYGVQLFWPRSPTLGKPGRFICHKWQWHIIKARIRRRSFRPTSWYLVERPCHCSQKASTTGTNQIQPVWSFDMHPKNI